MVIREASFKELSVNRYSLALSGDTTFQRGSFYISEYQTFSDPRKHKACKNHEPDAVTRSTSTAP